MGGLEEAIQQMIVSAIESTEITSANPTHINRVIQVNNITTPNLESLISGAGGGRSVSAKQRKEQDFLDNFSDMTTREANNLRSFAANPGNFMAGMVLGRAGSLATGAAVATAIMGLVQSILEELMQPGRLLDRRFKLLVDQRMQLLTQNQERADLSLGYKTIRTTAYPSPRGGYGVVGSNLHNILNNRGVKVYEDTEERGLFTRLS